MAFYNTDYDVITVFNIGYLAMKNFYYLLSLNLNIPFKKKWAEKFPLLWSRRTYSKQFIQVMNSQPVRNEYSIQNYLSLQRIQTKMRQPNKTGDERIIDGISEAGCFFYVLVERVNMVCVRKIKKNGYEARGQSGRRNRQN